MKSTLNVRLTIRTSLKRAKEIVNKLFDEDDIEHVSFDYNNPKDHK